MKSVTKQITKVADEIGDFVYHTRVDKTLWYYDIVINVESIVVGRMQQVQKDKLKE